MFRGSHNSATSYRLCGWQKYFSWFINAVSRCQTKTITQQYSVSGVRIFDIQVALDNNDVWRVSHGIAWYDITLDDVLDTISKFNNDVYVILGLDRHFGIINKQRQTIMYDVLIHTIKRDYPNIKIVRIANEIERTCKVLDNHIIYDCTCEKYWTISWAKQQTKKHWWKFPLLIPLPWLWNRLYAKTWLKEAIEIGKPYYMTDFV